MKFTEEQRLLRSLIREQAHLERQLAAYTTGTDRLRDRLASVARQIYEIKRRGVSE